MWSESTSQDNEAQSIGKQEGLDVGRGGGACYWRRSDIRHIQIKIVTFFFSASCGLWWYKDNVH